MGRPFRLASPKPSLIKIMPITGLHHRFLTTRVAGQVIPKTHPGILNVARSASFPWPTAVLSVLLLLYLAT